MKITTLDYILIAVGIFTLPFFIGLVILGVVMWRIGCRLETEGTQKTDSSTSSSPSADALKEADTHRYIEEDMESFAPQFLDKRYKLKQYSEDTLEDGK